MGLSEARKRANKKYDERNKEAKYYRSCKASCKMFITKKATHDDLLKVYELVTTQLRMNDMSCDNKSFDNNDTNDMSCDNKSFDNNDTNDMSCDNKSFDNNDTNDMSCNDKSFDNNDTNDMSCNNKSFGNNDTNDMSCNNNTFDSTSKIIKKAKYYDKLDGFIKSNNIDLTDKKAKSKAVNDFHATFDKRSKRAVHNDFKNYIDINQIGK